jgi:hypothetical protein
MRRMGPTVHSLVITTRIVVSSDLQAFRSFQYPEGVKHGLPCQPLPAKTYGRLAATSLGCLTALYWLPPVMLYEPVPPPLIISAASALKNSDFHTSLSSAIIP